VEKAALGSYGAATGQATNAYNIANPIYAQEATNPQGFTPQQKADMLTASNGALGGSNSAAVGQGALLAARTNNAGGADAAIADAARAAGAQQSQNALGVDNQSAMLARQQQQQGLAGLNGIYADANGAAQGYLGTAEQAAQSNPWMTVLQSALGGSSAAASAYLGRPRQRPGGQ
jgi:hypothetical protein